jgi:hypothetical protein
LQRYFFIIRFGDGREHGDDDGTVFANDGAARKYAMRIISELIDGGGCDDPGLSMIVKDAAERQIATPAKDRCRSIAKCRIAFGDPPDARRRDRRSRCAAESAS